MAEEQPQTLEESRAPRPLEPTALEPHFFVVLECDRPMTGGARHPLRGVDEVVVGRSETRTAERRTRAGAVELRLGVPGRWMSAAHARLRRSESGWTLDDEGSTNGCFVNGKRVARTLLRDGDVLELGHTLFVLRTALPTPKTPATGGTEQSLGPGAPTTLLPAFEAELAKLPRIACSDLPTLLLGETGTGKELLARAIHQASRRPGAFVALNCSALSPALVESQLFGHVKGAFSGAFRDELGFVRSAEHGTLLLDEIADLLPAAQGALLRVIQEREVAPVGSARPVRVDVRFLAATHRSLDALVDKGTFRGDLLARLDGFRCRLPPLGSRREDIGILVADLLRDERAPAVTFTREAGTALLLRDWPFNVRELLQCLKRAIALAAGGVVDVEHLRLPEQPETEHRRSHSRGLRAPSAADDELKRRLLVELAEHGGNVSEVARSMGKARMQVQRWIRRFGIDLDEHRRS